MEKKTCIDCECSIPKNQFVRCTKCWLKLSLNEKMTEEWCNCKNVKIKIYEESMCISCEKGVPKCKCGKFCPKTDYRPGKENLTSSYHPMCYKCFQIKEQNQKYCQCGNKIYKQNYSNCYKCFVNQNHKNDEYMFT